MNYTAIHDRIIERAKDRLLEGYGEWHHIVPVCLNGTNDPENLVLLTAEEHFLIHQLLVRIYPDNEKILYAATAMAMNTNGNRPKNKMYGWLKRRKSEQMKANPLKGTFKKGNIPWNKGKTGLQVAWNKGKKLTEEQKKNMGGPLSEEHKRNIGLAQKGQKRKPRSEETKRKIAETVKKRHTEGCYAAV